MSHLKPYKLRLENRALDQEWYELQQAQRNYTRVFEGTKIVYPNVSLGDNFSINTGCYLDMTTFCIDSTSLSLLGILNSKIVNHYLKAICVQRRGGYVELKTQYMLEIPIPRLSTAQDEEISTIVSELGKSPNPDASSKYETRINDLVRLAYGISESEFATIATSN